MVKRLRNKMGLFSEPEISVKRKRLTLLEKPVRVRVKKASTYPTIYIEQRFYWLHELCVLRAKRRYGSASKKDIKAAQRELAKLRK